MLVRSIEDWRITRRGDEPGDFWSQSFCWGQAELDSPAGEAVQVRFHNNGGKPYPRAEVHLVYETLRHDATEVRFAWTDDRGEQTSSHVFNSVPGEREMWQLPTGQQTVTRWVEFRPNY